MLPRQPVPMMSRSNQRKDHASSATVTAMEPNTSTPPQSAKSWNRIRSDSRQPCAAQRIANLPREAATENLANHTWGEGQGRSPTQSRYLPHLNHESSSISKARSQAAACKQRPTTTTMAQRFTPTSTPSITLNRTTTSHQREPWVMWEK